MKPMDLLAFKFDSGCDVPHSQVYRLIYVAIEDVLAYIHQRRTWRETRTGGLTSLILAPEKSDYPANGEPSLINPSPYAHQLPAH